MANGPISFHTFFYTNDTTTYTQKRANIFLHSTSSASKILWAPRVRWDTNIFLALTPPIIILGLFPDFTFFKLFPFFATKGYFF